MKFTPEATLTVEQDCTDCENGVVGVRTFCSRCYRDFEPVDFDPNAVNLSCGHDWKYLREEDIPCEECEGTGRQKITITLAELKDWIKEVV